MFLASVECLESKFWVAHVKCLQFYNNFLLFRIFTFSKTNLMFIILKWINILYICIYPWWIRTNKNFSVFEPHLSTFWIIVYSCLQFSKIIPKSGFSCFGLKIFVIWFPCFWKITGGVSNRCKTIHRPYIFEVI